MIKSFCALYTIVNHALQVVPLEHISYSGRIESGVARMTLVQTYQNHFSNPIDVTYQFPLLENFVFETFEAKFGDTVVKGQVKEKERARQEYDQSVNNGYQAALGSTASSTTDIMKIEIGNIPAGQKVVLTLTYDAPLDSVYEGNWEFKIPSTLTPRYVPASQNSKPDPSATEYAFTTDKPYTWDISIVVDWQGGFKQVTSPSHSDEVSVTPIGANTVLVRLSPDQKHYPNKDFRLVVQDKELYRDMVVVGESDRQSALPRYAAMIQFMPEISGLKDLDQLRRENMAATLGEFIFILDRSGSMMGQRIVQAREGLLYFLKSLPINSYFHIISFGSEFVPMARSIKYNDVDVEKAIRDIETYDADMGGTEILQPVQYALNLPRIENYQRNIFLLTDGSVSNSDEVVEVIKNYGSNNQARVFSIGVGNGCSETFIRKTAEVGSGKSVLLSDEEEDVEGKIVQLLDESLSPALSNFEVTFDKKFIKGLTPHLNATSHILRNQPFRLFALVDKSLGEATTDIKVSYFDSVRGKRVERSFPVSVVGANPTELYHRIFLKNIFDDKPSYLALLDTSQKHDAAMASLSVAFQVWAPKFTSFLCVSSQRVNSAFSSKVIVPNIQSVDYNQFGGGYGVAYAGSAMPMAAMSFAAAPAPVAFGMKRAGPMMDMALQMEAADSMDASIESEEMGGEVMEDAFMEEGAGAGASMEEEDEEEDFSAGPSQVESMPAAQKQKSESPTGYLVKVASIRGTWKLSQELLDNLKLKQSIPELKKLTKIQDEEQLATVLAAAFLLKNSKDSRSAQILLEKSKSFLDSKKIKWSVVERFSKSLFV